jgi:hypothetical protein
MYKKSITTPADVPSSGGDGIRDAVVGDSLVLSRASGGGFDIYGVGDGDPRQPGHFDTSAAAWMAIDALDLA